MMMVSNNSDFARRKLTFIRDASENESVLDAYLRMNEMLTELDTVRKMVVTLYYTLYLKTNIHIKG